MQGFDGVGGKHSCAVFGSRADVVCQDRCQKRDRVAAIAEQAQRIHDKAEGPLFVRAGVAQCVCGGDECAIIWGKDRQVGVHGIQRVGQTGGGYGGKQHVEVGRVVVKARAALCDDVGDGGVARHVDGQQHVVDGLDDAVVGFDVGDHDHRIGQIRLAILQRAIGWGEAGAGQQRCDAAFAIDFGLGACTARDVVKQDVGQQWNWIAVAKSGQGVNDGTKDGVFVGWVSVVAEVLRQLHKGCIGWREDGDVCGVLNGGDQVRCCERLHQKVKIIRARGDFYNVHSSLP